MPVNRVRADHELLGDLGVAQAAGDERQHLQLAARQVVVARLDRGGRSFGAGAEEGAYRTHDRRRVAAPREVLGAFERHEGAVRQRRRELPAQRVWDGAIAAPMKHGSRRVHVDELRTNVEPVDELEQRRGRGGVGGLALQARELRELVGAGFREEHLRQHARAEPPVRADERHERVTHLGRRDRGAVREGAEQDEPVDALGVPRRERDRRAAAGRASHERAPVDLQVVDDGEQGLDLAVQPEVVRAELPVGEPHPEPVVADERAPVRDALPELAERRLTPLELEVAHPPGGHDERGAVAAHLVRDAPPCEGQEADRRVHGATLSRGRAASDAVATIQTWVRPRPGSLSPGARGAPSRRPPGRSGGSSAAARGPGSSGSSRGAP
jgi:hypothetical protein